MDLVVLSEVRWGYFRTRKQFLLSRFPERWRVYFAQPPVAGGDDPWTPRTEGRVTYFTVPFVKPGTRSAVYNHLIDLPPARSLIERSAEARLRSVLSRLGVEPRPTLLVSNIYCSGLLSRLPKKRVFYDFNDSPFQFLGVPGWARDAWRRTARQVDAFFVVSEHYRRELSTETDRPLVVIGNGVETSIFETPRPTPDDIARLPRPLIGYIGLLSHFLDFDVLESLRQARRGGTVVLIGPGTPATESRVLSFAAREGVAVLGPRAYEEVPAYAQALDVGVIPFRADDPYVKGINPNKVYQYLAAGLPVVTTPVLDIAADPPRVAFAAGSAAMVEAVSAALAAPRDREALRALARPHDWNLLAAQMVEEIEQRLTNSPG